MWSFNDELGNLIDKYFMPTHPDIQIQYAFTPTDQFPSKLDPVLASGNGTPDVFALEDAFVRKYVESGLLLPLDDIYEEVKDKMAVYPMQVGSYEGHVYGISCQVTPGALFYRRSLAKKYFGTDDPDEIQKHLSDFDKFMETAKFLKEKSGGKCVIVSTGGDLFKPFQSLRKDPWVVNDKLVIDPAMDKYMDFTRALHDGYLDGRVGQWSEGWFAGMKGTLTDEEGNPLEVFCTLLPTWGLNYILKQNAPDTSGDWAMCAGPAAYRWGGTWLGAYKGTKNPNAAKELIKYIYTDDDALSKLTEDTGDVMGNLHVQEKYKNSYTEPFLGGQNHYAQFCEMAEHIDGSLTQASDQAIESLFNEAVASYALAEKTKEEALSDFKKQVNTTLGY